MPTSTSITTSQPDSCQFWGSLLKNPWSYVVLGSLLRLRYALRPVPLWNDEIALAQNILERGFSQLVQPLDHSQVAPIGFLWMSKAAVLLFGNHDWVFRLIPLLSSIGLLIACRYWAKLYLDNKQTCIFLFIISVSMILVQYSGECKQYEVDALAMVCLAILGHHLVNAKPGVWAYVMGLAVGLIAIWFSFTAIFVLAAIGLLALTLAISQRSLNKVIAVCVMGLAWMALFGLNMHLLGSTDDNTYLQSFWERGFIAFPPQTIYQAVKPLVVWYNLFRSPVNLGFEPIAIACTVIGLIYAFKHQHAKTLAWIFVLIMLLSTTAAGLQKYPMAGRLMTFTVPMFLMLITLGISQIGNRGGKLWDVAAMVLFVCMIADPIIHCTQQAIAPREVEMITSVLKPMSEEIKPDDYVYVHMPAGLGYQFYSQKFGITNPVKRGNAKQVEKDENLPHVRGMRRVWFVFSHSSESGDLNYHHSYITYLKDHGGQPIKTYHRSEAYATLMDLSEVKF